MALRPCCSSARDRYQALRLHGDVLVLCCHRCYCRQILADAQGMAKVATAVVSRCTMTWVTSEPVPAHLLQGHSQNGAPAASTVASQPARQEPHQAQGDDPAMICQALELPAPDLALLPREAFFAETERCDYGRIRTMLSEMHTSAASSTCICSSPQGRGFRRLPPEAA